MSLLLKAVANCWYQFSLVLLVAITVFSLIPLPELPEFPGSDKTHHFVAYAALMFPVALRRPKYWLWLACVFAVWSGAIELVQPLVNRYAEWFDLLANVGGLFVGTILGFTANRLFMVGDNKQGKH